MFQQLPIISKFQRFRQQGAAALELALLLPLLILLIDGVIEFGILLHNQSVLYNASQLGARASTANIFPKPTPSELTLLVSDYCTDNLMLVANSTSPVVVVVPLEEPTFQQPVRITVSYTFQGFLAGNFLLALQSSTELSATVVMYQQ